MITSMIDKRNRLRNLYNICTLAGFVFLVLFIGYSIQKHLFTSDAALETYLQHFGLFAPFAFIVFQVVQVVLPIMPGGVSCAFGMLIFGSVKGFIYNYIGICIGSIIAFLLARRYGLSFVKSMSGKKTFSKYVSWLQKPGFEKLFAAAIFMPIAPDDFFCYLAGVSKIKFKKFVVIILLGKPLAIAAYTFGLEFILRHL